jgi:hypothetical protein
MASTLATLHSCVTAGAVRRIRSTSRSGGGAERRVPEEAGPVERHPSFAEKFCKKRLAEKFAAVTPGDCDGRLVRVRYAPIAAKFRGAPK